MVEQHVEEVAELGRDAAVLQGVKISVGIHVGMNTNNQTNKNGIKYGSHSAAALGEGN